MVEERSCFMVAFVLMSMCAFPRQKEQCCFGSILTADVVAIQSKR